MTTQEQLAQIQIHIEKLQEEISNTRYFMANALCKETKDIYRDTLQEKQKELHLLLSQKTRLLK